MLELGGNCVEMSMPVKKGLYIDANYNLHYPEGMAFNKITKNCQRFCQFFFQGASHMDGFPDELREVIHEHWGQFPPQNPMIIDLFGIMFFFLAFFSFCGNGFVIYVFLSKKSLRTPVSISIAL